MHERLCRIGFNRLRCSSINRPTALQTDKGSQCKNQYTTQAVNKFVKPRLHHIRVDGYKWRFVLLSPVFAKMQQHAGYIQTQQNIVLLGDTNDVHFIVDTGYNVPVAYLGFQQGGGKAPQASRGRVWWRGFGPIPRKIVFVPKMITLGAFLRSF